MAVLRVKMFVRAAAKSIVALAWLLVPSRFWLARRTQPVRWHEQRQDDRPESFRSEHGSAIAD